MARIILNKLQEKISKQGYAWEAGKTSHSSLTEADQQSLSDLVVQEDELKARKQAITSTSALQSFRAPIATPVSIDWRNNGGDWTTPVRNQGNCASGTAFAIVSTIESLNNIFCGSPNLDKILSVGHLMYCACISCSTGCNVTNALDFCKNTGLALESDHPYVAGDQPCPSGLNPYVRINSWREVLTIQDRKNSLANKGPMLGAMFVYGDLASYRSGVYRHVYGSASGATALCIVGYDDSQQCWICKNSWGTAWGESGWIRVGYGECGIDTNFPFWEIELKYCPADDLCRRYISHLARVIRLARVNTGIRACLIQYVCNTMPKPGPIPPRPFPPKPYQDDDAYEYSSYPWPYRRCSSKQIAVALRVRTILARCPKLWKPFCRALTALVQKP